MLSPMYDSGGGRHYYVNELAELTDGRLIIPYMWFTYKGDVFTDCWLVTVNEQVRPLNIQ